MCHRILVAIAAACDPSLEHLMTVKKPGLYANIQAKKERIANGSGEHMNKPGSKDAPSVEDFKKAAKTEKKAPTTVIK
jgi:hypothetical protein